MSTTNLPRLTPRDFTILETMLADHLGGDEMLISAIRKKLKFAQIVFADDLPADVVTLGSPAAFTVARQ
ncbi:MAG TPA: nucleoside-diphosphate kinase, partial [Hyphomonas sp.]|nr:nucleoside-diphosphate kinase [Hyphomonas sp.]